MGCLCRSGGGGVIICLGCVPGGGILWRQSPLPKRVVARARSTQTLMALSWASSPLQKVPSATNGPVLPGERNKWRARSSPQSDEIMATFAENYSVNAQEGR
jgi:hypothetical protein